MSTRQKAQTQTGPSDKRRSPSPSSSSSSSSSSSTSSSHGKQRDDEQESKEVPEEQPNVPEPPPPVQPLVVEPSDFYKLSRRLSKKTPSSEAYTPREQSPAVSVKDAQETRDMPPPDIPRSRQSEHPPSEGGGSSFASAQEPESQDTHLSSSKRRRSWASITSSASDEERRVQPDDLQSHDPRPASVAMAGWGQGLGTATVVSSIPDEDRPALTKPLILSPGERIMAAGKLIDSTLPVQYEEDQARG